MAECLLAAVKARESMEKRSFLGLRRSRVVEGLPKGKSLGVGRREAGDFGSSKWKVGEDALRKNMDCAVAESTRKVYAYWWRRFEVFCEEASFKPLQASRATVLTFLSYLAEVSPGQGGVKGARAALQHYFVLGGRKEIPTEDGRVSKLIKGIERRFGVPVKKSAALGKRDFLRFLYTVTDGGKFEEVKLGRLRLGAQVAVMYCTFGRFEEVKQLKTQQLEFVRGDVVVTFRKGKTYQMGEARKSVMPGGSQGRGQVTPISVLKAYLARLKDLGSNEENWLFPGLINRRGTLVSLNEPASYEAVARDFKKVIGEAGLVASNGGQFGLHSMRRGAVTEAVNAGADEHFVMKQMRVVTSTTVRRYASVNTVMLRKAALAAL